MSGVPGKNSSSVKRYLSIHPENVHLCVIFTVNNKSTDNHFSTRTALKTLLTICPAESGPLKWGDLLWLGRCSLLPCREASFMAAPQLLPSLSSCKTCCCPSASFCVWGVVGKLQYSSLRHGTSTKGAGARNPTWQPGRCKDILHIAHLCKQCGMGQEEGGLLEGQISYRLWASPEFNP